MTQDNLDHAWLDEFFPCQEGFVQLRAEWPSFKGGPDPFEKLANLDGGESSAVIRARVEAARKIQAARFAPVSKPYVLVNGDMGPAEVQQFCRIDEAGKNLMQMAMRQRPEGTRLSARSHHRVLKLAQGDNRQYSGAPGSYWRILLWGAYD